MERLADMDGNPMLPLLTRREALLATFAAVGAATLPATASACSPPSREEALSTGLLPDAPNPNGWPYRLGLSLGGGAKAEIGATHHLSIQFLGRDHVKLWKRGLFDPEIALRCWMPGTWQKARRSAALDELDFVERFVARLPAEATLHVFSLSAGHQAAAMALGLLAARTDPDTAVRLMRFQSPFGAGRALNTDQFIIEVFDERYKLNGRLVSAVETAGSSAGATVGVISSVLGA